MANITGVVAEWLAREYAGKFAYTTTLASIGTSAAFSITNNPERAMLLVINCSVNTITLLPESLPTAGSGIILSPSGGFYGVTLWDDLIMPSLQYGVVSSGAASTVLIVEVQRIAKVEQGA